MISTTLINATDLTRWADRRDAQEVLPRVIRRLVYATVNDLILLRFAAGEWIQLGGWDGITETERGNAFVPAGLSVWEIGVGKNPKEKADDDYIKRTKEPRGVTPSETAFIFVTPRRWGNKHAWENDRRDEGIWRDVRAYDADDLEGWLENAPAVHLWLSSLLREHPQDAEDFSTYWANWSATTNPAMSPDLVLAGRDDTLKAIHIWLETPTAPLRLRGESRAEAIAVFAAAMQKLSPGKREQLFSRAVLVQDVRSWNQLAACDSPLVLIPAFECNSAAMAGASRNNHSVVLPLGRVDTPSPQILDIPRVSADVAEKALTAMGVAEN
jgi:hypothetical protein